MTANLQEARGVPDVGASVSEERQRVLLEVNNAIVTCLDRESLFRATTAALKSVVPFDRAALHIYDPVKEVLRVFGVTGPTPLARSSDRHRIAPAESRNGWVLDHGVPLITSDMRDPPPFLEHAALVQGGLRSAVSVPMSVKGKIIEPCTSEAACGAYGADDASLLLGIGEQVALAIENLLAYEEIAALKARLEEENVYLRGGPQRGRVRRRHRRVPAVLGVLASVRKVAKTDSTVLVTGETARGRS